MTKDEKPSQKVWNAVYRKSSRRGFLAHAAGALMAVGVGEAVVASPAEAATNCCNGLGCESHYGLKCACEGGNPATTCPPDWPYTGYTWTCCGSNGRLRYCTDCRNGSSTCFCACHSPQPCTLTMTELAQTDPTVRR